MIMAADVSFLNSCYNGKLHTYAKTKELRKKAFKTKGENIKQTIGIQVTFILEIKLQEYAF